MYFRARHINPRLVLVQPRKTRPNMNEIMLHAPIQEFSSGGGGGRGGGVQISLTKKSSDMDLLQSSGEYPCAVCRTGVGNNSIYCNGCKLWVHKKCSGLQRLTPNPDYRCARCMGNARPIDGRPQSEVQVGPDKLEVVASFCYLGDMLSAGEGCEMAVTTRVKIAWKKFRELLPVLISRHLSYKTRGHVYSS